jgi:hypothetical protein
VTHAEVEATIDNVVLTAIHLPPSEALRVCRWLRDAADDILQIVAAAEMPPPPPIPAGVVPIRPGADIKYVDVKAAAAMLGMGVTSLYARLEEPPFKALLFENGTNRRLFRLDALENFIRQRQG